MGFWGALRNNCLGCCGGPHGEHYDGWLARERLRQYHASEAKREALQRDNFALEMRLNQAINILDSYQSFTGSDALAARSGSIPGGSGAFPGRRSPSTRSADQMPDTRRSPSFTFKGSLPRMNPPPPMAATATPPAVLRAMRAGAPAIPNTAPLAIRTAYSSSQEMAPEVAAAPPRLEGTASAPPPPPSASAPKQAGGAMAAAAAATALQAGPPVAVVVPTTAPPAPTPAIAQLPTPFADASQRAPVSDNEGEPPASRPAPRAPYTHGYAPRAAAPPPAVRAAPAATPRRARPAQHAPAGSTRTLRAKLGTMPTPRG